MTVLPGHETLVHLQVYPGWNCLNFLHVFVGYQPNFGAMNSEPDQSRF